MPEVFAFGALIALEGGLGHEGDRSKKGSSLRERCKKWRPGRSEQSKIGGALGEGIAWDKPVLLRTWSGKAARLRADGRVFVKTFAAIAMYDSCGALDGLHLADTATRRPNALKSKGR